MRAQLAGISGGNAGELSLEIFFKDQKVQGPPLRAPGRTTRRRSASPRLKFIYRCTYCEKQFTKTMQSPALGAHKTKGENAYGGRTGYFVGNQIFLKVCPRCCDLD
jgi:hypothetical protein